MQGTVEDGKYMATRWAFCRCRQHPLAPIVTKLQILRWQYFEQQRRWKAEQATSAPEEYYLLEEDAALEAAARAGKGEWQNLLHLVTTSKLT